MSKIIYFVILSLLASVFYLNTTQTTVNDLENLQSQNINLNLKNDDDDENLPNLESYNADINQSSVSGLSAGGFMAVQFQMAYSDNMVGAGIVAGGPMMCAKGNVSTALTACMSSPASLNLNSVNNKVFSSQNSGEIDSLENLRYQNIYLYSGTLDKTVKQGVMEKLEEQYREFGAENIKSVFDVPSSHAWITDNYGNSCDKNATPYISNCDYNQAVDILSTIYGDLNEPVEMIQENLIKFNQSKYTTYGDSLNKSAFVYVPTACQNGEECKVHISFHGCQQTQADIGEKWEEHTQLNEVAEANNIIVLYPQTEKSLFNPSNPNGCFDWWGYTESSLTLGNIKYATKKGKQMKTIYDMLKQLTSDFKN